MNYKMVLVVAAVALIGGCRAVPIYNVADAPVIVSTGRQVTMDEVKGAILRAGSRLGWQMSETSPGLINARIALRTHTAGVDVKYSTKNFSIVYRESTNLEASGGNIHKNYNGWIENLDRDIRAELARM
ncbi:MAG: hypothetical protein ABI886_02645 [Betaproteobacteria bacterium]